MNDQNDNVVIEHDVEQLAKEEDESTAKPADIIKLAAELGQEKVYAIVTISLNDARDTKLVVSANRDRLRRGLQKLCANISKNGVTYGNYPEYLEHVPAHRIVRIKAIPTTDMDSVEEISKLTSGILEL